VVRRCLEVDSRCSYPSFMDDAPDDPPSVPTFDYISKSTPFIETSDSGSRTTVQLTTACKHRGRLTGHLVT